MGALPKHLRNVTIAACEGHSDGAKDALEAARALLAQKDGLWIT